MDKKLIHTPTEADFGDMASHLAMSIDPVRFAAAAGLVLDPWQAEVLRAKPKRGLVCCSRQSGKTTISVVDLLHTALFKPRTLSLLVSASERQAKEALLRVKEILGNLPIEFSIEGEGLQHIIFGNGSRIIATPSSESTTRGYTINGLLVIDEAARTPDTLYAALSPALAVGGGRLLALSTPAGTSGWYYNAFFGPEAAGWQRWTVPATECPRLTEDFLAQERAAMGHRAFQCEYMCEFIDDGTSVFDPDSIIRAFGRVEGEYDEDWDEDGAPLPLYIEQPPPELFRLGAFTDLPR